MDAGKPAPFFFNMINNVPNHWSITETDNRKLGFEISVCNWEILCLFFDLITTGITRNLFRLHKNIIIIIIIISLKRILRSRFHITEAIIYATFVLVVGGDGADELCALRNRSRHLRESQHAVENATREQLLRVAGMTHQVSARNVACIVVSCC